MRRSPWKQSSQSGRTSPASELAAQGVRLTIARAKTPIRKVFDSTGITELLGSDAWFPTVGTGVEAFRRSALKMPV